MLRVLILAVLMLVSPALASAQSLKGVWLGVFQLTIGGPNDGQLTEFTQQRYLIYTDAFFNYTFPGEGERPTGDISDAQFLEWAQQYISVGGTYIRDGFTIRYNRRATLGPNGSSPENQPQVREIRTLTANRLVTQATNADGVTTLLIYNRIE